VGDIILNAYHNGARLDAWEEYANREIWRKALECYNEQRGENAWARFSLKEKRF